MDVYLLHKGKIYGPLAESRLLKLADDKKLTEDDTVAASREGPWQPVSSMLDRIRERPAHANSRSRTPSDGPRGTHSSQPQQREQQLQHREQLRQQRDSRALPIDSSGQGGILRVQRPSAWTGALVKMKVFVDGDLVTQLPSGATADIPVAVGAHVVEAKGGGAFLGAKHNVLIQANSTHVLTIGYGAFGGLKIAAAGVAGVAAAHVAGQAAQGATIGDAIEAVEAVQNLFTLFSDE